MRQVKLLVLIFFCMICKFSFSQSFAINTTGSASDPSAMLDVASNNKGILIPRMSTTERIAITTPATSLMVYQTDGLKGYYYYDGSVWVKIGEKTANSCLSVVPLTSWSSYSYIQSTFGTNTVANLGQVCLPLQINASQITVFAGTFINTAGSYKIALYSEDGQTKIFEITTATISSPGYITYNLGQSISLNAGFYYVAILPLGTASLSFQCYYSGSSPDNFQVVNGRNVLTGTMIVTPGILPGSFNPTTLTYATASCLQFRLDY